MAFAAPPAPEAPKDQDTAPLSYYTYGAYPYSYGYGAYPYASYGYASYPYTYGTVGHYRYVYGK